MKKYTGFLSKSYVYNYKGEITITYDDFIKAIKKAMYENFRFCPPEKQIKISAVEEWSVLHGEMHLEVHFALIDIRNKGLMPKRYYLDFFSGYMEKSNI